jgi:spore maturation protein CgeB
MKKKILYIDQVYNKAIPLIENKIKKLNYNDSIKEIHSLKISWSDIFQSNFKDFNFIYFYPNIINLQKKWCSEKKINYYNEVYTLINQINLEKPDLIFFQSTAFLYKILKIKKLNYKYFFWDGTSKKDKYLALEAKGVISNMNTVVKFYKNLNLDSVFISHFYDERIKKKNIKKKYFLTFIGSVSNKNHFDRCLFLYMISRKHKINFFIGDKTNFIRLFGVIFYNFIFKKKKIKDLILYLIACKFIFSNDNGPVFGIKMYEKIIQSKIVINFHLNTEDGLNMRLFEVTGSGTCLLTDSRPNMSSYFKINKEIFVFKNVNEAISIIDDLKKNPQKIYYTSIQGFKKTMNKFTFKNKKKKFLNFINKLLKSP